MDWINQESVNYIWMALFVVISVVRKIHEAKAGKRTSLKDTPLVEGALMIVWGVAAVAPFFYIYSDWIDFANYSFSFGLFLWVPGIVLFLAAIWMVHRSHSDLGKMWDSRVSPEKGGKLVTEGVYRKVRHPMYTGHLLCGVAQLLLFPNYLAGPLSLVIMVVLLFFRIPREEKELQLVFGREYTEYMKKTRRLF